jgi:Tubulin binding cofactor A
MADSEASRSLSIKTGVVSRLHKELLWYEAETQKEAAKTESLRASGACPHDVKQQVCCSSQPLW